MSDSRPDAIDIAAGLRPTSALFDLRTRRPQFVSGAEACRVSVLSPTDDVGLGPGLRAAVAHRAVAADDCPTLLAQYEQLLTIVAVSEAERALAQGAAPDDLPEALKAIAAHADMIARTPGDATETDIRQLTLAGLTDPQIVALSELLAFVSFQVRIVAGLSLMRQVP